MSYSTLLPEIPLIVNRLPLENGPLHHQQLELSTILETATDYRQAQTRLAESSLANSAWDVEAWQPSMLEAAIAIAKKWKNGF